MNKRRETVLKDERKKRKSIETEWKGSLTVEASCVMAVVLFSLAALIGKAGQIHDETAAGIFLGFWKNMLLLSGGLFLCFPAAVYLMIKGRKARNTESIPFLPFVFPVGLGVLFL